MRGARTHGVLRIILTTIGLNGLVVLVWLLMQNALVPSSAMSSGSSAGPPQLRADWIEAAGAWFDVLSLAAIFGILLGIAAWRIWGPVRMSAPGGGGVEGAPVADDNLGSQPGDRPAPPATHVGTARLTPRSRHRPHPKLDPRPRPETWTARSRAVWCRSRPGRSEIRGSTRSPR
jgi:hypothetical protein